MEYMLEESASGNSKSQLTWSWSWFLQNFAETSSAIVFLIFLDSTTKSFSSHPFTFTIASALPTPTSPLLFLCLLFFFALFFHQLSSLSLTLITIIYCLNTSLLLHLVTTHFYHTFFHI